MTEYNRKSIKAIFENAGIDVPPKDVLTELCELHQQNTAEKDEKIKEMQTSLTAAEQERDALKDEGGEGFKQKYEETKKELEMLQRSITEEKTAAAKEAAARSYFDKKHISGKNLDIAMLATAGVIKDLELDGDKFKDTAELDKVYKDTLAGLSAEVKDEGAPIPTPPEGGKPNAFEGLSLADKMKYANEHPSDPSVKAWLNK